MWRPIRSYYRAKAYQRQRREALREQGYFVRSQAVPFFVRYLAGLYEKPPDDWER